MLHHLIQAVSQDPQTSQASETQPVVVDRSAAQTAVLESLESRRLLSAYAALQRPTELQYWDTTNAYNGYNFYGAGGTSYLLDMDGRVVHTWPLGTNPHLLTAAEATAAAPATSSIS